MAHHSMLVCIVLPSCHYAVKCLAASSDTLFQQQGPVNSRPLTRTILALLDPSFFFLTSSLEFSPLSLSLKLIMQKTGNGD